MNDRRRIVPDCFRVLGSGCAAVLMLAALVAVDRPALAQPVQQRIIGVYRLARYAPHGDHPIGRITYDASGRVSAMIFPPDRSPLTTSSLPEDYRSTMRGVIAYYGTYTIDEPTGRVIHHVEAASNPAWIGDLVRWYRFEGPNLLIGLNPQFENPLLWERLPDSKMAAK